MIESFYNYTANFFERTETENDLGGQIITYSNCISTPCYITNINGDNAEYAGKDMSIATHELSCSYTAVLGVNTDYVCRVSGMQFDILDIATAYKQHHVIFKLREVVSPKLTDEV